MFKALKWAACGLSVLVAVWLVSASATLGGGVAATASLAAVFLASRCQAITGQLRLRPEGFCELLADGQREELVASSVFSGAGWLVLRLQGRAATFRATRTLVLAPDAATPEDLRRLRVWLNLAAPRAELNSGGAQWS